MIAQNILLILEISRINYSSICFFNFINIVFARGGASRREIRRIRNAGEGKGKKTFRLRSPWKNPDEWRRFSSLRTTGYATLPMLSLISSMNEYSYKSPTRDFETEF